MGLHAFRALLIYPAGIAALGLLYMPFTAVAADLQKGVIAAFVMGVMLIATGIAVLSTPLRLSLVPPLMGFAGAGLLIVSAASAVFHGHSLSSYFGTAFESGSVGFFALLFFATMTSSLLNRTHMRLISHIYIGSVLLAALTGALAQVLGVSGTLGWSHLSFLVSGALLLCVLYAEHYSGAARAGYLAAAGVSAAALLLFFHPTSALISGAILAVYALARAVGQRGARRIAPFALMGALLLCGAVYAGAVSPMALPLDVRPSVAVTEHVGAPIYLAVPGAIVGSGPNTFGVVWERNRPAAFNATPLWDNTFTEGFSTGMTWLVTLGFLGALAYLFMPFSLLVGVVRATGAGGILPRQEQFAAAAGFVAFSFAASLLYAVSVPLLLMGGVYLGFCARMLSARQPVAVELTLSARALRAVPLCLAGAAFCIIAILQFSAASLHARGVESFMRSDISGANERLSRAARTWPLSLYSRDASRAALESVRLEARGVDPRQETIQSGIAEARRLADLALAQSPGDYAAALSKGSLLVSLVVAGVGEMAKDAGDTLTLAQSLSPTRPEPSHLRAVLANALGKKEDAIRYAREALARKPDYQPSLDFLKAVGAE